MHLSFGIHTIMRPFFFFFFGKWNYETYISDAYKALTKTLKKNKEFENHHTHEEKSGSS